MKEAVVTALLLSMLFFSGPILACMAALFVFIALPVGLLLKLSEVISEKCDRICG